MVARKVPAKKAAAAKKTAAVKKAVAANAARFRTVPTKKAAAVKKAVAPKPEITIDDLPKTIRQIILAKAEGDVTRISIVSHTEIIIHNPRNGE